mgnify:CR=1 FL=1
MLSELGHSGQLVDGGDVRLQGRDVFFRGLGVGVAVVLGVDAFLSGFLQRGLGPLDGDELLGLGHQILADLLLADIHTEAVLGVVLEQGVAPCRAVAVLIRAVRGGSAGAAPNGRAAGGVGDVHTVAEELSDETGIAGLGAAAQEPENSSMGCLNWLPLTLRS